MQIITNNSEPKLLELVRALQGDPAANYALNFNLSHLLEENRSDFQIKIAVNVLNDIFRDVEGSIFVCSNDDIVVVYHGNDRVLLEKAIFQLRYLFTDDPIATNDDGSENEAFCDLWDLGFQWRPFNRFCQERVENMGRRQQQPDIIEEIPEVERPKRVAYALDPEGLVDVMGRLGSVDVGKALRSQPVCARAGGTEMRQVFFENYVNIAHLGKLLDLSYNLLSDKSLFKYITQHLDGFVLETIASRPTIYLARPISLNLNIETVLSEKFSLFSQKVKSAAKSIIIEIHVSDMFADMYAFNMARELAQKSGYRICLDGLTNLSFIHVDRESLGFDLAKLFWNADMEGDLGSDENRKLAQAIKKCGSNRMILSRCDSHHAISYGKALGISLFQGRYPDRILNPSSKMVN